LVLDRDLNGYIDQGSELFNNALVQLGSRGLGSFAWFDANGYGVRRGCGRARALTQKRMFAHACRRDLPRGNLRKRPFHGRFDGNAHGINQGL
jgi:hypothetical protein